MHPGGTQAQATPGVTQPPAELECGPPDNSVYRSHHGGGWPALTDVPRGDSVSSPHLTGSVCAISTVCVPAESQRVLLKKDQWGPRK
jgi:hypothetical protein